MPAQAAPSEVAAAVEHSQDFPFSAFKVATSRIQKAALSKVNCPVPSPEAQLALIASKKGKSERLKLWWHMGCSMQELQTFCCRAILQNTP